MTMILFFISIVFLLFLPGYALLLVVFGKSKFLSFLERFVFSLALSITSVDFIFFLYSKLNWSITRLSSISGVAIFILICLVIYKINSKKWIFNSSPQQEKPVQDDDNKESLFNFSKKQFFLLLLFIFLMIFLKTIFLAGSILPTSTDMGHHMYWSKWMAEKGQLPTYDGMPDFIVGEHIIFALINLISQADFFGAFPTVILHLINVFSVLAVFVLLLRIFPGKNIALAAVFLLGTLFAVSSPQSKFVSTGVIGNIFGNLFIPTIFYFYIRALEFLKSKQEMEFSHKKFLATGIFLNFGLFYTHHLSSFVFLFVFFAAIFLYVIFNLSESKNIFVSFGRMLFSPLVLGTFLLGLLFFFFIFTPNYARLSAVDTAVGSPVKITRVGLTFDNLKSTVGESRLALGFLGLCILLWKLERKNFGQIILIAWMTMIFLMSTRPGWLMIDLPSSRVGNYFTYPVAVFSSLALAHIFLLKNRNKFISGFLFKSAFGLVLAFLLLGGLLDSIKAFKKLDSLQELTQTFNTSQYLAEKTSENDIILKDHNYLTADSWMKLFFMRGYRYPLSRGYFKRYEDETNPREMCTLWMISNPGGKDAKKCFTETGTDFLVVNPQFDSLQFSKLENFDKVYSNEDVAVFYKK